MFIQVQLDAQFLRKALPELLSSAGEVLGVPTTLSTHLYPALNGHRCNCSMPLCAYWS